ncbi:MAG: lytic transglycosylase domain-containing protein [Longimicrobiales bacterium]
MSDGMRYMTRLFVSMFRISTPRPPKQRRIPMLLTIMAICAATYGYGPAVAAANEYAGRQYSVQMLRSRLTTMEEALNRVENSYEADVAPIERMLTRYRDDNPRLVRRVAVSLVREGRRTKVDPRLLVGVLLVENPDLDPHARSVVGATGLMQVMPLHRGNWKPCGTRLDDVESNICTGSRIFADALKNEGGNVTQALLRYNGCRTGSNTPDCHAYPRYVLARAHYVR